MSATQSGSTVEIWPQGPQKLKKSVRTTTHLSAPLLRIGEESHEKKIFLPECEAILRNEIEGVDRVCVSLIGKWATAFYIQVWLLLTFYHKQVRKRKSAKERRTRNQNLLSFARYVHIGKSKSCLPVIMLPGRFNSYWDSIHGFHYWQNLRHVTHERQNWGPYDWTNSQSSSRRSPPPSFRASTNNKVRASHHTLPR